MKVSELTAALQTISGQPGITGLIDDLSGMEQDNDVTVVGTDWLKCRLTIDYQDDYHNGAGTTVEDLDDIMYEETAVSVPLSVKQDVVSSFNK